MPFLKKALSNVNETTLAIQKFGVEHQMKMQGLEDKPLPGWRKYVKLIICYGGAILVGVMYGFFYGIMALCLIMFMWNIIEGQL